MDEMTGALRPAVRRYLHGAVLQPTDIPILRAYLRQWIDSDLWRGTRVDTLRSKVDSLTSREQIEAWSMEAEDLGIDPW